MSITEKLIEKSGVTGGVRDFRQCQTAQMLPLNYVPSSILHGFALHILTQVVTPWIISKL